MSPNLPVELYVQILTELPAKEPSTLTTIVSFLSASTALRTAALQSTIWRTLYNARYTQSDDTKEKERQERLGGDPRLMFIERYKIDCAVLRSLKLIRREAANRDAIAGQVVQETSFDAWDALQSEMRVPIPKVFRDGTTDDMEEEAAPHAIPRRYWAKALLGAIARSYAVRTWTSIRDHEEERTFDDVLLGFSAFIDVSPMESLSQLDALAARCREQLVAKELVLDAHKPGYNLRALLLAIREYMHDKGFAVATGAAFLNPLNQFPPHCLGPGRSATIPMSMNWVFASICRRLMIQAGPTSTPGKVLCHITSPDPRHGDMLFDVCATTPPVVFSSKDLSVMLAEAGMPDDSSPDAVLPARLTTMVRRAAYNILHAVRMGHFHPGVGIGNHVPADFGIEMWHRAKYAAELAVVAVSSPRELHLLRPQPQVVPADCPLDLRTVALDPLLPFSRRTAGVAGPMAVFNILKPSHLVGDWPRGRPFPGFEQFVGQAVNMGEVACIIGWEWVEEENQSLVCTHYVLCPAGITPCAYSDFRVLQPAPLTVESARQMRRVLRCFDQYFEDAVIPREDGIGGRLVPSEELQAAYPSDLEYGARWTEQELSRVGGGADTGGVAG